MYACMYVCMYIYIYTYPQYIYIYIYIYILYMCICRTGFIRYVGVFEHGVYPPKVFLYMEQYDKSVDLKILHITVCTF